MTETEKLAFTLNQFAGLTKENFREITSNNYDTMTTKAWKHLSVFFIINACINLFLNFYLNRIDTTEDAILIVNLAALFLFIFCSSIMIFSYKTDQSLTFMRKLLFVFLLLLFDYFSAIAINFINFFDRVYTIEDVKNCLIAGVKLKLIVTFPLTLLIVFFIKNRVIK